MLKANEIFASLLTTINAFVCDKRGISVNSQSMTHKVWLWMLSTIAGHRTIPKEFHLPRKSNSMVQQNVFIITPAHSQKTWHIIEYCQHYIKDYRKNLSPHKTKTHAA